MYVDDAISGAEFDRRPGLMRLLNGIRPRAPFAALVIADKDRLGREQFETNHILKQISLAGVRIFEYQNGGQEVRLESPIDKLIMSVSNFAAELERAKASQRTRDALQLKAQRGYVAGGVVFGYRNVPVLGEGDRRSHVVREVRDDEAATVRRIFEMATAGVGLEDDRHGIERGRRALATRARGPPSFLGALKHPHGALQRALQGRRPLGTHQEAGRLGPSQATGRPASEWVVTKLDRLRIVSDELWASAHDSLRTRQKSFGLKRALPRLAGSRDSKYLLSGFVRVRCVRREHGAVLAGAQVGLSLLVQLESRPRRCAPTPSPCPRTARTWPSCTPSSGTCSTHRRSRPRLSSPSTSSRARTREAPHGARICELSSPASSLSSSRYADAIADAGPLDTILQAIKVREERRERSGRS